MRYKYFVKYLIANEWRIREVFNRQSAIYICREHEKKHGTLTARYYREVL